MRSFVLSVVLCGAVALSDDPPECRTDVAIGSCVFGDAYTMKIVQSQEECCDICGTDDDCVAWNLNAAKSNSSILHCSLKNESSVGKRGGSCLANGMINPPPSPGPPPAGPYAVSRSQFNMTNGWLCGADAPTVIWYPTQLDKGPFPVLSFGHGSGGSLLEPLQESVASLGFIIMAPKTGCCNDHGQDILHVLDWCRYNKTEDGAPLHEALNHADWSRAGVYGHSFGSAWATDAVRRAENAAQEAGHDVYNIKAAVFSHGGHKADDITIPSMFTTGRGGGSDYNMYSECPADHKVYAAAKGAGHMEPIQGGRLNAFDGHFFGCHVAELQTSCDKIYGDGDDSICKAQEMDGCEVTQPSFVVA